MVRSRECVLYPRRFRMRLSANAPSPMPSTVIVAGSGTGAVANVSVELSKAKTLKSWSVNHMYLLPPTPAIATVLPSCHV